MSDPFGSVGALTRVDGRGPARRQIAPRAAVSARAWLWLGASHSHAPARRIYLFFFCTPHRGNEAAHAAAVHRGTRRNSGDRDRVRRPTDT
jgi:hypothetical protein